MTALLQKIIFLAGLFTYGVFSNEMEPYLTITVNNLPLRAKTVEVSHGQSLRVDCTAHPSDHSALWLRKGKYSEREKARIIDDSISSNVATLNLTDSDVGVYVCRSAPTKLEKTITVVATKRTRRDDVTLDFRLPEGRLPTFEDALRIQQEFIDKYKVTDYNNMEQQRKDMDTYFQAEIQRAEEAEKRKTLHRTIGITVGVIAIGGVLIAIMCVLCRNSNRKRPTPVAVASVPTRTTVEQLRPLNSQTARTQYGPIETHITPYPPASFAVRPTAPPTTAVLEPETPPPPSYTEAVNKTRPTAPIISA